MTNLESNLARILNEKTTKIVPQNIKKDVQIFDVVGTLESGDGPISQDEYDRILAYENEVLEGVIPLYTELEYIESTGTQYINTNYRADNADYSFDIQYKLNTISTDATIQGINKTSSSLRVYSSSNLYLNETHIGPPTTNIDTITYNRNTGVVDRNGTSYITPTILLDEGNYVHIFRRSGSDSSYASMRLYYFKLYDRTRSTLLYDFIPVKRISDNAICLYDKCSYQFFLNQGTGVFIAGPEKGGNS